MSTPLDYAEFYFDHVDKEHEMTKAPEGVAAPLEPLEIAAQKIAGHMGCCVDDIDLVRDILNEFAAAVSKNLQEERDQTERKYQMLLQQRYENMEGFRFRGLSYQELTEKLAKFAELEKEIAALRETKP